MGLSYPYPNIFLCVLCCELKGAYFFNSAKFSFNSL